MTFKTIEQPLYEITCDGCGRSEQLSEPINGKRNTVALSGQYITRDATLNKQVNLNACDVECLVHAFAKLIGDQRTKREEE